MGTSANLNQLKAECNRIAEEITPEMLTDINKYLENDSPQLLIQGLEEFVALLRNAKTASNNDVELYMASHEKLIIKLQRINASDLTYTTVERHRDAFNNLITSFQRGEDSYYLPIIQWG